MSKKRNSIEVEESSLDDLIKLAKGKDHTIDTSDNTAGNSGSQITKKQRRNKGKAEKKKEKAKESKHATQQALEMSFKTKETSTKFEIDDEEDQSNRVEYPYVVEDDDHCESPLEAYEHIATSLKRIADVLKKDAASLAIYDPYYCEGSMVDHLHSLGFLNVYNKKEDFYAVQKEGRCPPYDVLVTNPPYSVEHIPRLLQFSASSNKPFFLLMPNFVYAKDYYYPSLTTTSKPPVKVVPFYVSPHKRYSYTTPKGRRQLKSAKYTSPFPSFWYCHLGDVKTLLPLPTLMGVVDKAKAVLSADASKLPIAVLHDSDPRKKKEKNAKKREKHKVRKQQKAS
jgi:hypothetical protein